MIRVHLITGFLGTGKTTAILDLLTQVPAGQKWAVLVNEFGEVGVDVLHHCIRSQGARGEPQRWPTVTVGCCSAPM